MERQMSETTAFAENPRRKFRAYPFHNWNLWLSNEQAKSRRREWNEIFHMKYEWKLLRFVKVNWSEGNVNEKTIVNWNECETNHEMNRRKANEDEKLKFLCAKISLFYAAFAFHSF